MAGMYGGYDPYNPGTMYGVPSPYSNPYNARYTAALPSQQPSAQIPQNIQQTQSNVPWIQVPNIEAARNVMVQPNQTAYMMNQNAPEFYVKATDAMGVATLRCFKFAEFNPTEEAAKEVLSSQAGNLVSREEFNNFANNVAAQFNAIQQGFNASNVNTHATQQARVMEPQNAPQTTIMPITEEVVAPKKETTTRKKEAAT